ncbi:hypothetical protein J9317_18460 [Metabacillus sp. KIGAM252]|uniref:Uncharacterized protein n=1 Tax=Metabacillus flavus TaxID=2823519 RepID=A0ABS5LJ05_9BACI|nr:hypothetical protein [Metabacillus flavus]MBS2970730.1 hypothetical protein [Metabacillus flavus]
MKKLFRGLAILSFAIVAMILVDTKVHAQDMILPFNVETNGALTEETKDNTYLIHVPESGRVHFDMTSYVDKETYIALYDLDNKKIFDEYSTGSSLTPARYTRWEDLEAGTYRLKIYDGSWSKDQAGTFKIKTTFASAGNTETEPNNGTIEAQSLPFNKTINGFLSWDNTVDYYKVTVPSSGRVSFDFTSYVDNRTYISLIDEDNNKVFDDYITGTSKNPSKDTRSVDLNKGSYYLKVYDGDDYDRHTGKYVFKAAFSAAGNGDTEPNNGIVEAISLQATKKITGFLAWDDTVDIYKIDVKNPGKVTVDLTSYVDSRTYIEIVNSNNKTISDEYVSGSSINPSKYKKPIMLDAGSYYIKIYDGDDYERHTGKYYLTVALPADKHLGRILIRSNNQYLYNPKGTAVRKLKAQEGLRVYKVLADRYDVGGGNYVKKNKANLFYLGHVWSSSYSMRVYTPEGYSFKSFDPKEPVRVYGLSDGRYNVGGGYYIIAEDYIQFDR